MDLEDCIRRDRATRSYTEEAVDEEDVRAVLDAARRAGSGKNRQPVSYVVVRDRARLDELASYGEYTTPLTRAPVGIVALVDRREDGGGVDFDAFDCGRAVQNLKLAATNRGLGTVPQSISDRESAAALLDVPADKEVLVALALGHPADEPDGTIEGKAKEEVLVKPERDPLDEVVHWGTHR